MSTILIVSGHTDLKNNSFANKIILERMNELIPEDMYQAGGIQRYPIEDFLIPLKQFAKACGMIWEGYIYSGGLSYASRHDDEKLKQRNKSGEKFSSHSVKYLAYS